MFEFCSQFTGPNTSFQHIPNALLRHSNIETGIFKEGPIEVKHPNLSTSPAKLPKLGRHTATHITGVHSETHLLYHPLHSALYGKWKDYLSLPCSSVHFLLSTLLTSTVTLLLISCWTINIIFWNFLTLFAFLVSFAALFHSFPPFHICLLIVASLKKIFGSSSFYPEVCEFFYCEYTLFTDFPPFSLFTARFKKVWLTLLLHSVDEFFSNQHTAGVLPQQFSDENMQIL